MDTFAALIFHNLFGRFPGLRILSVENGSRWVAPLLQELDAAYRFVAGNPLSRTSCTRPPSSRALIKLRP